MKKFTYLFFSFILSTTFIQAQDHGFPFGRITYTELNMNTYALDTAAAAVVLEEFGEAYIDNGGNHNLIFERHLKIKILKQAGTSQADFAIFLYKQDNSDTNRERIRSVVASSFNIENNTIREVKLDAKSIFKENVNKYYDATKFAIPNVRVGSVIEVHYVLESPFIFNFRTWEFQSDIPKVSSEYWATIPGNYVYNMSLKGFLKLSKNENELVKNCFEPGGGNKADCARYKFGMKNIPAFTEEDFMTAKSNFISAINFELSEVKMFSGGTNKVTKEWKDAEDELRKNDKFGVQLKRGKDIVEGHVSSVIEGESDPLRKASKIYDFIKFWYQWDEVYGKYSEFGIKKAFAEKKGNVGDINLSLIAALRYAGFKVDPVILSTRENGLPIELHPVISDFNYVIAKLNLEDKSYLLDATDDFLPFGMLPERCINGNGRVLGEKESSWVELKPTDKAKELSQLNLKLDKEGKISGTILRTYMGYSAVKKRKRIHGFSNEQAYVDDLNNNWHDIDIKKFELKNLDDLSKPLAESFEVVMDAYDGLPNQALFNPFILGKWNKGQNPFRSPERLYPVDFGVPLEETLILNLELPEGIEVTELPENLALGLPNSGGRYIYQVTVAGNKLMANNSLVIARTVYSSAEYHYLKELFNRIVYAQNIDLVFKRK
ncbi:MAG: DUF3857 domain-containing protein [Cyclobacteriaceae bacterium]|nr:DUF3857 domain-containing protein [Cyclobacteriaceae bacterium]